MASSPDDKNPQALGAKPDPDAALGATMVLIARARNGEALARNLLIKRHLPALRRFAHGRLPSRARGLVDTDDLVQNTMVRALDHLNGFEPRRAGSFLAYLRQILVNQIRDEIRKVERRPGLQDLDEKLADPGRSPVETIIGAEAIESYERALKRLSPDHQEAVVLRLELGFSYEEVAEALDRPTANAARLVVTRALLRLAEVMNELDPER